MWKESLKQGAIATEHKPDPDLNTDYRKSVPGRQAAQVKRGHVYFKNFLLICLILGDQVIIFEIQVNSIAYPSSFVVNVPTILCRQPQGAIALGYFIF